MRVLAIGAHGDDLEAFCGGTLARCAQRGDHVVMCVVTDGRGNPRGNPDEIAAIRKAEAQESADLIGAELLWMGVPDGNLMIDDSSRFLFVEAIRTARPDFIITHPPDDYHPDHNATSQLVMDAVQVAHTANYRSMLPPVKLVLPVAFMDSELGINFLPEEYVNITNVWDLKVKMLCQHRSQQMPGATYDSHFVLDMTQKRLPLVTDARILSEFRGMACHVEYAEGFRWWRAAYRLAAERLLP